MVLVGLNIFSGATQCRMWYDPPPPLCISADKDASMWGFSLVGQCVCVCVCVLIGTKVYVCVCVYFSI